MTHRTTQHGALTRQRVAIGRTPEGREVFEHTFSYERGVGMSVMDIGATLTSLRVPDARGRIDEITLGFDNLAGYLAPQPYMGATVGRCANRIAGGAFELDGKRIALARNEGERNHLHGGNVGFDKVAWEAETGPDGVVFHYTSEDGEEGYPGRLSVSASYVLTVQSGGEVELVMEYEARTTAPTPVNMTNHAYWNLGGDGSGSILDHECTLSCTRYLPVDSELIPTGEVADVRGTPMDFTHPHRWGERIGRTGGGYDHCFVLDDRRDPDELRPAAVIQDPKSGRRMEVLTNQESLQLYTGNFLDGLSGRGGRIYIQHSGFCIEPEGYPDAVNKPHFPSIILGPGENYRRTTAYRFSTSKE